MKIDFEFWKSIRRLGHRKLDFRFEIRFRSQSFKICHDLPLQFHNDFDQKFGDLRSYYTNFLSHLAVLPENFANFFFNAGPRLQKFSRSPISWRSRARPNAMRRVVYASPALRRQTHYSQLTGMLRQVAPATLR